MAVDLMVTAFVGGASIVTVGPAVVERDRRERRARVVVGDASGPTPRGAGGQGECDDQWRRRGRVRRIEWGSGGSMVGARQRVAASGVGCTSHLRRAAHVRAARPDHNRSGSAHRVGPAGGGSASGEAGQARDAWWRVGTWRGWSVAERVVAGRHVERLVSSGARGGGDGVVRGARLRIARIGNAADRDGTRPDARLVRFVGPVLAAARPFRVESNTCSITVWAVIRGSGRSRIPLMRARTPAAGGTRSSRWLTTCWPSRGCSHRP